MSVEIKAVPGIIRTLVPNTDTGKPMCAVTFYLDAAEAHRFLELTEGQTVTLTVPEGKPVRPCDCVNAPEGSPDCRHCGPVKCLRAGQA